jgi:hypothetical protein
MLTKPRDRRPRVPKLGWGSHVQIPLRDVIRHHNAEHGTEPIARIPRSPPYRYLYIFLDRLVALLTAFVGWRAIKIKPGLKNWG